MGNKAEGTIKISIDKSFFSVSDNGGGVPADIIDRIFEPYFTTKFKSQGVGVSLFMVKGIVENKLHAKLTVYNEGEGAVFRVDFAKE